MTSTSDGSQAKAFAQQYAKELQEEKKAKNDALVDAGLEKREMNLYMEEEVKI